MAEAVLARRAQLKANQAAAAAAAAEARSYADAKEAERLLAQPPPTPATPEEEMGLTTDHEKQIYRENLARLNREVAKFAQAKPADSFDKEIAHLFTVGLTVLSCMAFGTERIALWQTKKGPVRAIFEHEDPEGQCNNTIGRAGSRPCWICGMPIDPTQRHPTKAEIAAGAGPNPLAPECEHILPIAQAAIFLDLHSRATGDPARSSIYALEYDWAHSACNQGKNDDVYVDEGILASSEGPYGNLPTINSTNFVRLLNQIRAGKRDDKNGSMVKSLNAYIIANYGNSRSSQKNWIEARLKVLDEKYRAIYGFIATQNKEEAPALFMLALASCVMQLPNRIKNCEKRAILGLPSEIGTGSYCAVMGGRRTRRRTRSFLHHKRRRTYHAAIKMSSKRHSLVGKAAKS